LVAKQCRSYGAKEKMKSAASFTPIRFGLLCVAILGCLGLLARVGWLQIVSPIIW
jgi:cell division protein FtsI (penicillin-binding protein 3)